MLGEWLKIGEGARKVLGERGVVRPGRRVAQAIEDVRDELPGSIGRRFDGEGVQERLVFFHGAQEKLRVAGAAATGAKSEDQNETDHGDDCSGRRPREEEEPA